MPKFSLRVDFSLCLHKWESRLPKYDCLYAAFHCFNKSLFSFLEMTRSRQSENCLHLFTGKILNARIFTTQRISIFMFMEELNLISPPLQLRMLWKILRFKLFLFVKRFVMSHLFYAIFHSEKVSVGTDARQLSK